jgi:hypothetical protein
MTSPFASAGEIPMVSHRKRRIKAVDLDPYREIRRLIWLYIILWLIEGGLRRWFLPGLATPLLLIRDPVALAIYYLASSKNIFPVNGFIFSGVILAFLTFFSALLVGHGNAMVALYGVRCDFVHVPLIFIMGRVLRQEDLIKMAKIAVYLVVPYTALLVAQFYQPQDAWVNRGVGGSLDGAGFSGAEGHFRPPGTFSFITGPAALYPLFTACWFIIFLQRKLPLWLLMASGAAILVAIPISISRLFCLSVVIVAAFGMAAMVLGGRLSVQTLLQIGLAAVILPMLALQIPAFQDGMSAFNSRWETATTDSGGFQEAIVDRVFNDLFGSFSDVGVFGLGTGYSTNVGQQLLTQNVGIGAAESEWGKLLFDDGLILGSALIIYRMALAGSIFLAALRSRHHACSQGLIFASAAFLLVMEGQWSQPSILGASVIAGGLTMAASNMTDQEPAKVIKPPLV